MLAGFTTLCQQIEVGLTDPTPEQQQEVFRLLIDHVVVEQDAIVIKHIIPTDDDCRLLPGRREVFIDQLRQRLRSDPDVKLSEKDLPELLGPPPPEFIGMPSAIGTVVSLIYKGGLANAG